MSGASVLIDIIGRDRASAAFDKSAASAERAAGRMGKAMGVVTKVGATLTKAATVPLVAIAAVSVHTAIDYQKSMTLLQTAGGETAAKMQVIGKGIQKVAVDTGTSLGQLGEGMYIVAKAGAAKWSAVGQLQVLKAAAQGAKAEHVDLGVATNALTSIMLSYKMGTGQAVEAENMLIRGSGLAKTTFADFAGSLSSVVPLAASLGIKFSEVAGAEATMTQHGESAQQSTQNLHSIITALAGQSTVATGAMAQLGINTVDLAANLGKRGLAASLAIVDKAIKAHTHNGMVMLDSYKASKIAAQSLRTEMKAMPATLAKESQALLDGKIHRSDYLKDLKHLSLEHYTLGRNFLTTANQAMGFNANLKAGKGSAETTAKAYQTMLGGVTGMNVALMVGGEYMGQTKRNIDAVAAAAKKGGVDVLGWADTQGTMSVKIDKAKAALQVLSLEIGTALIPAVSKVVGWVRSGVTWFENLSTGWKKTIGYAALVVAALGPVLTIFGRISRAIDLVVGAGKAIGGFATKVAGAFASTGTAATAASLETEAAALAQQTTAANSAAAFAVAEAAKANAAAEAAVSIAAAVEGTDSVLAAGASASAEAAIEFAAAMQSEADAAIAAAAQVAAAAESAAAAATAAAAETSTATSAAFGPVGLAIGAVVGVGALAANALGLFGGSAKAQIKPTDDFTNAILSDNLALGANTRKLVENSLEKKGLYDAGLKLGINEQTLTDAMMGRKTALDKVAVAQRGAALGSILYSGMSDKARQTALGLKAANDKLASGLGDVRKQVDVNKTAADHLAAADGKTATSMQAATKTAAAHKTALEGLGKTSDATTKKLNAKATPKVDVHPALTQIGVLGSSADGVAAALNALHPTINADVSPAEQALADLMRQLSRIPSSMTVAVNSQNKLAGMAGHAGGGTVADGWFTVGEEGGPNGWELGRKSGSRVEFYSNKQSQKMLGRRSLPGYAKGTKHQTYNVGGVQYTTKTGAANAQHRLDAATLQNIVSAVAGMLAAGHDSQAVYATIRDAANALRDAARSGKASAASLAAFDRSNRTLLTLAARRDSVRTQLGTAPSAPTAYDRLATAQGNYNSAQTSVSQAITGGFDVTTAGQVYKDRPATAASILAALKTQVAKAKTFGSVLTRLGQMGLAKPLLMQLAQAGPDALGQAQALAAGGTGTIRELDAQLAQLDAAGSSTGTYVASSVYGAGVQSAKGLIAGLQSQESALNKAIRRIGDGMVAELKHTLKIHSPSRVMHELGGHTIEGYRLGMVESLDGIRNVAKDVAHAAHPAPRPVGGYAAALRMGGGIHVEHLEIHDQPDPVAAANAVTRRLARMGSA